MPFTSTNIYNENRLLIDNDYSVTLPVMESEQQALGSTGTKQINYSRYKTELCRQFSENGECKYGDKCQFAHGFNDLKDVNRHPKYKTDYCKTFHSKGFCPYGPRCHFIHEFYEKNTDSNFKSYKNNTNMNKKLKSFKPGFQQNNFIQSQGSKSTNNQKYNDFNDYRLTTATTMPKDVSSSMSTTSVSSCLSCSSSLSSSSSSSSQSPSPSSNYSSSSSSLSLSNIRSTKSNKFNNSSNQPLINDTNVLNYILATRQEQEVDLIELTRHLNLNCLQTSSPKTVPLNMNTLPEQGQQYQMFNNSNGLDNEDEYSFYYTDDNDSNCLVNDEVIKQR